MANLADLQAELMRKKSELKAKSVSTGEGNYVRAEKREKTSTSIFAKKNKGVAERSEKDAEQRAEEEQSFENARKKLEIKAKMYDKMARGENGVLDEEKTGLEDRVMVDFQTKALDHFQEQKAKIEKIREEEEKKKKIKDLGDGKVEFTDSLGRTRIVNKGDVKDLMEMDKELRDDDDEADNPHSTFQRMKFIKSTEFEEGEGESTTKGPEAKMKERLLVSSDMQREELRQKWEKEEEALLEKGDVHYQDVQFDEVRDLGTGYFGFSRSQREREKQKEELTDIREETLTARERAERVKAKRAEMMKARLAKVKARRGIEDSTKEEEEAVAKKAAEEEEEAAKKAERQRLFEDQLDLARRAKIREWDQGKEATLQADKEGPSWESKTEEMRNERNDEFAPPQMYEKQRGANNYNSNKRKKEVEEEDEDPVAKGLRNLKNLLNL